MSGGLKLKQICGIRTKNPRKLINVWNTRPGVLHRDKSILVWAQFILHLICEMNLHEFGTVMAVILGGLASVLQFLDFRISNPFMESVRAEWMVKGDKTFQKG